jgi:hypothetical protein
MRTKSARARSVACVAMIAALMGVAACSSTVESSGHRVTTIQITPSSSSPIPTPSPTPTPTPTPSPSVVISQSTTAPAPKTSVQTSTASAGCSSTAGFDCDFQTRFAAAQSYIATRPGTVGIVIRDRTTGAIYRNPNAGTLVWTASTTKLAMTADLFEHSRDGSITLSAQDRTDIAAMLHSSDDDAADELWFKYGASFYQDRFTSAYGMASLTPIVGYSYGKPYWGFEKCTPDDLDHLIQYVLGSLNPADTAYIVDQLRNVDPVQQWGVWGAGPAAQPGNKDGWSEEDTGWVINSVGFVGPNARYTMAIMNSLNGNGGYDEGTETVSQVAQLIFGGRF